MPEVSRFYGILIRFYVLDHPLTSMPFTENMRH